MRARASRLSRANITDLVWRGRWHLNKLTQMMGTYQLGAEISEADAQAISAFMATLEGEVPADYIKEPELPESGPDTPAADPS